jgi:hypothetical protein
MKCINKQIWSSKIPEKRIQPTDINYEGEGMHLFHKIQLSQSTPTVCHGVLCDRDQNSRFWQPWVPNRGRLRCVATSSRNLSLSCHVQSMTLKMQASGHLVVEERRIITGYWMNSLQTNLEVVGVELGVGRSLSLEPGSWGGGKLSKFWGGTNLVRTLLLSRATPEDAVVPETWVLLPHLSVESSLFVSCWCRCRWWFDDDIVWTWRPPPKLEASCKQINGC